MSLSSLFGMPYQRKTQSVSIARRRDVMSRHMRKLTYGELEEHVRFWYEEQVIQNQEILSDLLNDESIREEQLPLLKAGIAQNLIPLQELILPFKLDDNDLYDWAESFIKRFEYAGEREEKN
jgi:hypothetical protein